MNNVTLVGNLVRDVEKRSVGQKGTQLAELCLAWNERVRNEGEEARGHFFEVKLWGGWAANFDGGKGDTVLVSGELRQDQWQDKETGANRSKVYVNAYEAYVIKRAGGGRRRDAGSDAGSRSAPAAQAAPGDDNLPF